jgi:hypothetical protein
MEYQVIFVDIGSFLLALCISLYRAELSNPSEQSCQNSIKRWEPRFVLSVSAVDGYLFATY